MFKPRKPVNRRKKLEEENGVDMEIEGTVSTKKSTPNAGLDEAPAVIVKSDKKKKKKKPKSSGLSFADDDPSEDSTDFKLKKSSR